MRMRNGAALNTIAVQISPYEGGDDRGMESELYARTIAGADVTGDDRRRADIDRERAGERDPEHQVADTDGGQAIGADEVADERRIDGPED